MARLSILLLLLSPSAVVGWLWSSNATWAETFHGAMESSATLLENLGAKLYQHPVVEAVCQQRLCRNGTLIKATMNSYSLNNVPNVCTIVTYIDVLMYNSAALRIVADCQRHVNTGAERMW